MGCFLYFIPGAGAGVGLTDFERAGIGSAWPAERTKRETLQGPIGQGQGVVVADSRLGESRVGVFPDRQTWHKVPGSTAWCGYYSEDPPTPDDLLRADPLPGHRVTLADGRPWLVPVARGVAEDGWYHTLPRLSTLDESGDWTPGDVVPRYRELWETACKWWDAINEAQVEPTAEGARLTLDFAGIHDAAVVALAANYRVGRTEAAVLGLFDDRCVRDVLDALIDGPTLIEFAKKKIEADRQAAGSSSEPGKPADSPTTDQP